MKGAVVLPPIATTHQSHTNEKKSKEEPAKQSQADKSQSEKPRRESNANASSITSPNKRDGALPPMRPLPPVNYYYVSGRCQLMDGSFWNTDLNQDYDNWLRHRKHIAEAKGRIDHQGLAEPHQRYQKFRRRVRRIQNYFAKQEIQRQNREMYGRVKNTQKGISVDIDPFTHYVEAAIKKRYEYGRYLFQKKVTRENTVLTARINAAKPWMTAQEQAEHYAKMRLTGEHYRKFKNLEDLKQVLKTKRRGSLAKWSEQHLSTTNISARQSVGEDPQQQKEDHPHPPAHPKPEKEQKSNTEENKENNGGKRDDASKQSTDQQNEAKLVSKQNKGKRKTKAGKAASTNKSEKAATSNEESSSSASPQEKQDQQKEQENANK